MSRDFYSYDPQDTRDATSSPLLTAARAERLRNADKQRIGRCTRTMAVEAPEARERNVLKPEREDSPRAYYVRDRAYLLRESEIHTLSEVGRFRVVAPR